MSLPSQALFIKDGQVVGLAYVNCGYYSNGQAIARLLLPALVEAKSYFTRDQSRLSPERKAAIEKEVGFWFTTLEDLETFDAVTLYGHIFPRSVYAELQTDGFNVTVEAAINAGAYRDLDNLRGQALSATRNTRGVE